MNFASYKKTLRQTTDRQRLHAMGTLGRTRRNGEGRQTAKGDERGEVNTINVRSERKRRPNRNAAQTNLSWKLSCAPIKLINWPSQA